jgi:TolA-binding protein
MSMCKRIWFSFGCGLLWAMALSACGTAPVTSVDKKIDSVGSDSNLVQTLQRQVRERDKRIAELESQLEDLRMIDQDVGKRKNPIRPPVTLTPAD